MTLDFSIIALRRHVSARTAPTLALCRRSATGSRRNEWTRFYFQRRGQFGLDGNGSASTLIPLWEHTLGEPYCRGYRDRRSCGQEATPVASDFPNTHFRESRRRLPPALWSRRSFARESSTPIWWSRTPRRARRRRPAGFRSQTRRRACRRRMLCLQTFLARAKPSGVIDIDDMPVFVSHQVLEEAAERTHAEEGTETGGILIGTLWRDAAQRQRSLPKSPPKSPPNTPAAAT